ncbi:hypothetical protein Lalb_Chr17g0339381 [Lupinus albus]|uniref:Uncharacterized protein n=1 Tax=Lupinus albus TaxID=3870 RepID=A0A6A4P5A8_LUPAL|nr:hypothetical protein Lalb_Chr17g0339381 [Lupinus albus]
MEVKFLLTFEPPLFLRQEFPSLKVIGVVELRDGLYAITMPLAESSNHPSVVVDDRMINSLTSYDYNLWHNRL